MFLQGMVFTQQLGDAWLTAQGRHGAARAAGKYLVHGMAVGHERACNAVMSIRLHDGQLIDLNILVPRSGRILEMVSLPAGVDAIRLKPRAEVEVSITFVELRRLTWVEYRVRQLRRAIPVFFRQPRERRARAGFRVRTLFTDLDYAYRVACRFRANAYTRSYADWHDEFYCITPDDRAAMRKRLANWKRPPQFKIFVLVPHGQDVDQAVKSAGLDEQIYRHFSIVALSEDQWIAQLVANCASVVEKSRGDAHGTTDAGLPWAIVLRAGTCLSEAALYWLAHTIEHEPACHLVYADHDVVDSQGRLSRPAFKPDWSPELLRANNYIGEAFTWRMCELASIWDSTLARKTGFDAAVHSLLLALTAHRDGAVHVPAPLWHIDDANESADPTGGHETSEIVAAHLNRRGVSATVSAAGPYRCHVRYEIAHPLPLVSIIIPTRDGLAHLQRCVDSLLCLTDYAKYEVIVVDNQSAEGATLAYLDRLSRLPNVRVLPFDEPFNYSKLNNAAVAQAKGELICLLNNDTEVISPDWLGEMVGHLLQEKVGVVGAKLLYPNETVQHGGDTVGPGGCANHLHSGIARNAPGYCGRALVAQDLSAVTAACLLTRKDLYESLGGLNEVQLTVAFNDVDYCLRVRDAGYRVVWTPHALLYHHESVSRGKDTNPAQIARARAEVDYMRTRWAHLMHHDPFYNPNLNYQQADFGLSSMPNVQLPWAVI